MLKGYKYRLHPTPVQAEFLIKTIGCARFIYNKLLEDRIAIRDEAKAGIVTRRKPATPASYKPLFPLRIVKKPHYFWSRNTKRSPTNARTSFTNCRDGSLTRTKSSSWRH